ncbi:MAG: HlyD family efflux transporter periplasmic adaptor subunit [Bacteroidetes bacterium]|nr:HlyD family efflux transporter periplasmic adaptor subunit [Bacteroidota bacterium]
MRMKNYSVIFCGLLAIAATSCSTNSGDFDATGNFEADEVIVSAEASGKVMKLNIKEGQTLSANEVVGYVDTTQLYLRKKQYQYSINAVLAKQPNTAVQLSTITEQLATATREKKRVENLLKADAATQKQLDDYNAQIDLLKKQYDALQSSLTITTRSLQTETLPYKAQLDQIEDQLKKSIITNPMAGTVLTQYTLQDEVVNPGKALYKIADLSTIVLRVYISGTQLSEIKLGQEVKINVDKGAKEYKTYTGTIAWVSDKAEFTPKTIQTKDERANLVYAIKILVKNDGFLKLGMYGEVKFK